MIGTHVPTRYLCRFLCLLQQTRHDFDVLPSLPANRIVGVETYRGKPIDVELPSSVSGQHVVNFSLWVDMSKRGRGRADTTTIRAKVTLPVHLRYPDPACKRREEDCEGYAWVEVSEHQANVPHVQTDEHSLLVLLACRHAWKDVPSTVVPAASCTQADRGNVTR